MSNDLPRYCIHGRSELMDCPKCGAGDEALLESMRVRRPDAHTLRPGEVAVPREWLERLRGLPAGWERMADIAGPSLALAGAGLEAAADELEQLLTLLDGEGAASEDTSDGQDPTTVPETPTAT